MKSIFKKVIALILVIESRATLSRYQPRIIAVTGSVGKTSTKDAITTALTPLVSVRKSQKSFNSDIGVPLTILGLPNAWDSPRRWFDNLLAGAKLAWGQKQDFPEWLVLEIGADHPGDIKSIAKWLRPNVVVLTRFPDVPVHVEFFASPEAVIEEKRHMRKALLPDGLLVVNADDERTLAEPIIQKQRKITFGEKSGATIRAESSEIKYENGRPVGLMVRVSTGTGSIPLLMRGAIGTGHMHAALAALSVVHGLGLNIVTAAKALSEHQMPPGRMRLIEGKGGSVIIDDTYNASPVAVEAGLEALGSVQTEGERIFVLADMKELGVYSKNAHRSIGVAVGKAYQKKQLDYFLAVGTLTGEAADAATENGMPQERVMRRLDAETAATTLVGTIDENDVVLVKGSQSMRMERVVKAAMAHPEEASKLLVRQESEWEER